MAGRPIDISEWWRVAAVLELRLAPTPNNRRHADSYPAQRCVWQFAARSKLTPADQVRGLLPRPYSRYAVSKWGLWQLAACSRRSDILNTRYWRKGDGPWWGRAQHTPDTRAR